MKRIRHALLITLGLSILPCAFAHDPMPGKWCLASDTAAVSAGSFHFTQEQLEAYREAHDSESDVIDGETCSVLKTCGIVDNWYWANRMATDYCDGGLETRHVSIEKTATETPPLPFVSAPHSFLASSHHGSYHFEDGDLVGVCVACPLIRRVEALPTKR